jgi:ABC-type phosphate transport system substrate-binding protein
MRFGRAMCALLIVVAATAASTVGTTRAHAAGPRTLTVTPATGFSDQVALAQWSGFDPTVGFTDTVTLLQCRANPHQVDADSNSTTADDCLTAVPFPFAGNKISSATTQADGTGSAFIEILPAAQAPALNCSETTPCSILAYENNGTPPPTDSLPTTAAVAPITFAKSIDDCPPVTSYDLRAEGEASAAQLMYGWAANLCTANPKLILDYTETSSVSGREDFLNRLVEVGVTSMPPTSAELAAAPGYPKYTYAPLDLGADVIAYNMNDPTTGKRITNLTLSPRLVARIISDTDLIDPPSDPASIWRDKELLKLNPGVHWPDQAMSQPLLRAEQNADTYITTDWIAHDPGAEAFLQGHDQYKVPVSDGFLNVKYPTDIFENLASNDNAYVPIQGERPVARKVFYAVTPSGNTPNNPDHIGFVGVLDLSTALRYGLPTAKLVNAAGVPVAPDAAGLLAGYQAMKTNPDGITKYPDFTNTNAAIYPLVKVDYAMIPTQVSSATDEANLKRFLTFVAGQGESVLPVGYAPMPADLAAQDLAAAAKITLVKPATQGTKPPTTTPGTTTPTTAPPLSGLGSFASNGSGDTNTATTPVTTSAPTTTTTDAKKPTAKAKSASFTTPIVDIAATGERMWLPLLVLLALLAGLYPLTRRARPYLRKGFTAARARVRWPSRTPSVGPTS